MIYYIIPTIIIISSLIVITFIILKNLSKTANINIESIVEEKETQVKNRLIAQRLNRKFLGFYNFLKNIFEPIRNATSSSFSNFYKKIIELEKKTAQEATPLKSIDIKQQVKQKLELADKLLEQSDFSKAEENYIEVIDLDSKNIDAYLGLVKIYIENRDYKKARETSRYCIKLLNKKSPKPVNGERHRLACCYADLGSIYQLEDKAQFAFNNFKKAIELEPNNPRFLDNLVKISIMLRNKDEAWQAFNALKKADSENQKLSELKKEIDSIDS